MEEQLKIPGCPPFSHTMPCTMHHAHIVDEANEPGRRYMHARHAVRPRRGAAQDKFLAQPRSAYSTERENRITKIQRSSY
jgi:Ni,Fe-hydrogenase I small subunit